MVPAASLESPEVVELSEIDWRGRIWVEDPGFRLEAAIGYEQTITCDRCLARVAQRVDSEIHLMVLQNVPQPVDEEIELSAEDLEVAYVEGEELDADHLLREQLQLNVPMRFICRDDCAGLCPECGIDRNREVCDCDHETVDPRWEALRSMKVPD